LVEYIKAVVEKGNEVSISFFHGSAVFGDGQVGITGALEFT
jgi:hypothetical protein